MFQVSMSVVFIVNFPVFVACTLQVESPDVLIIKSAAYPSKTAVDHNLNDFTLNNLCLLLYANTDTSAECLS